MIARLALLALLSIAVYAQGGEGDAPPFLEKADAATRASFFAVLKANQNKPEPQVNSAVDQWASAQTPAIKLAYTKFRQEVEKHQKKAEAAHKAAVAAFSPAARAVDVKLNEIASHEGLSPQEKHTKIESIINSLDASTKKEIMAAMGGNQ